MTDQITVFPTPLMDAAKALRVEHNAQFAAFTAERTPVLNRTLTKDEAVDMALKQIDAPRSSISKKDAVAEIVAGEWGKTEIAERMRNADRAAGKERCIIQSLRALADRTESVQKRMVEVLAGQYVRYNTHNILDAALDLQQVYLRTNWWERVGEQIASGTSPVDALIEVRMLATLEVLSPYENKVVSRSTSLVANLTSDLKRSVTVDWLAETSYITHP